jgi:DNA replication protein DnaC
MTDATADCSLCGGTGMRISRDAQGDRVAAICSCRIARQALRRLERANIPRRHEHVTFADYDTNPRTIHESLRDAHQKAVKFVDDYPEKTEGRGLIFVGLAGLGKTFLAVAILRCLIEELKCSDGLFCDYGDLLKQIQNSYNSRSETTEYALLRPVLEAEVLVLDDLGSTKPTAWVWDTVAHVLNSRYNHKRTTIITTNFANCPPAADGQGDALGDRIGERMRSRVSEMCMSVPMQGKDYRQGLISAQNQHRSDDRTPRIY